MQNKKIKWIIYIYLVLILLIPNVFAQTESESSQPPKESMSLTEQDVFLYKTIPGDSLWNIAQRHLNSINLWMDLKKMNNLPNSDHIEPGTIIKVPRDWLKKNESTAVLVNAIGDVSVVNVDKQTLALNIDFSDKDNLILNSGDIVRTGGNGLATLLFNDGSRLLLQSDSELVLNDLISLGDGSLSDIKLELPKGRMESRVYTSPISNTNVSVKTATAITSVRGTVFRIGLDDDGDSITEVISGKVVARGNSDDAIEAELTEGQAVIVSQDGTTKKVDMLGAPIFAKFPQLIEHVPIRIDVEAVEDVIGYQAKIVPVGADEQDAVSSIRSLGNVLLGEDLPDGRYVIIVNAIDKHSVSGIPAKYEFILKARPFSPELIAPKVEEKVLLKNLTFQWNKVNDEAKKYYLQVARDSSFRDIVIDADNLNEPSFKVEDLIAGIYFWRVASIDDTNMRGPFSSIQTFRVLLEDSHLNASHVRTSDVDLTWDPLEEDTVYLVQISTSETFEDILLEYRLPETKLFVEGLVPGTYFFRVQSTAGDGYVSEWAPTHKFEVLDVKFSVN